MRLETPKKKTCDEEGHLRSEDPAIAYLAAAWKKGDEIGKQKVCIEKWREYISC